MNIQYKSAATIHTTSNRFFSLNEGTYDLIFVDGLHLAEACYADVKNALGCLNEGGVIVVDDLAPQKKSHQTRTITDIHWTGDVWKSWFMLAHELAETHEMFVVDVALGVGIIRKGKTEFNVPPLPSAFGWRYYCEHREEYHKMIPYSELCGRLCEKEKS